MRLIFTARLRYFLRLFATTTTTTNHDVWLRCTNLCPALPFSIRQKIQRGGGVYNRISTSVDVLHSKSSVRKHAQHTHTHTTHTHTHTHTHTSIFARNARTVKTQQRLLLLQPRDTHTMAVPKTESLEVASSVGQGTERSDRVLAISVCGIAIWMVSVCFISGLSV